MAYQNVIPGTGWVVVRTGVQGVYSVRRIVAWAFDERGVGAALIANQLNATLEVVTNDGSVRFKHVDELNQDEQAKLFEATLE